MCAIDHFHLGAVIYMKWRLINAIYVCMYDVFTMYIYISFLKWQVNLFFFVFVPIEIYYMTSWQEEYGRLGLLHFKVNCVVE